jgi:hypothetical protein
MTSAEMEAAITNLMLGKSAFGATPMGGSVKKIRNLITKDMMPKVLAAHKADQKELLRLIAELKMWLHQGPRFARSECRAHKIQKRKPPSQVLPVR